MTTFLDLICRVFSAFLGRAVKKDEWFSLHAGARSERLAMWARGARPSCRMPRKSLITAVIATFLLAGWGLAGVEILCADDDRPIRVLGDREDKGDPAELRAPDRGRPREPKHRLKRVRPATPPRPKLA